MGRNKSDPVLTGDEAWIDFFDRRLAESTITPTSGSRLFCTSRFLALKCNLNRRFREIMNVCGFYIFLL